MARASRCIPLHMGCGALSGVLLARRVWLYPPSDPESGRLWSPLPDADDNDGEDDEEATDDASDDDDEEEGEEGGGSSLFFLNISLMFLDVIYLSLDDFHSLNPFTISHLASEASLFEREARVSYDCGSRVSFFRAVLNIRSS